MRMQRFWSWLAVRLGKHAGIVTVIGFAAWVIWEWTDNHPIVDVSLFENRNFAFGTLAYARAPRSCRRPHAWAVPWHMLHGHAHS